MSKGLTPEQSKEIWDFIEKQRKNEEEEKERKKMKMKD